MDRAEIIKGLEEVRNYIDVQKRTFESTFGLKNDRFENALQSIDDALALLQAQEPVKPIEYDLAIYQFRYICGSCRHRIWREYHFCPNCGRAVKWE